MLASDDFEGRGPGTRGETKAVAYIESQFKADGLIPSGDAGGWTQAVTLKSFHPVGEVKTSLSVNGASQPLKWLDEIVVRTLLPIPHVSVVNAPLVFVGYGVSAPERRWDDFKGADLKGKIAVVLVNDPDFELAPGDPLFGRFDGKAETYYGRWTYKYEEAARQGAGGVRSSSMRQCPRPMAGPRSSATPIPATRSSTSSATIPPTPTLLSRVGSSVTSPWRCSSPPDWTSRR